MSSTLSSSSSVRSMAEAILGSKSSCAGRTSRFARDVRPLASVLHDASLAKLPSAIAKDRVVLWFKIRDETRLKWPPYPRLHWRAVY